MSTHSKSWLHSTMSVQVALVMADAALQMMVKAAANTSRLPKAVQEIVVISAKNDLGTKLHRAAKHVNDAKARLALAERESVAALREMVAALKSLRESKTTNPERVSWRTQYQLPRVKIAFQAVLNSAQAKAKSVARHPGRELMVVQAGR